MKKTFAVLVLLMLMAAPAHAAVLIKAGEAALPAAPKEKSRGISRGPGIRAVSPAGGSAAISSPFTLKVLFEPHGGATIDPSSVEVVYLKTPFVDLTERVKDRTTQKGIDMPKAEAPPGEHRLRISVTDSNGQTTSSEVLVVIK